MNVFVYTMTLTIGTSWTTLWWAGDVNSISISESAFLMVHSIRYTRISLDDLRTTEQLYWPASQGRIVIGSFTVSGAVNVNKSKISFYHEVFQFWLQFSPSRKCRTKACPLGIYADCFVFSVTNKLSGHFTSSTWHLILINFT